MCKDQPRENLNHFRLGTGSRNRSVTAASDPYRTAIILLGICCFLCHREHLVGDKTPMAWAAERFDRHHAIGAERSGISSSRGTAAANQATRPVVQPRVVSGVPIDAMGREVEGIVIVGGASS